MNHFDEQELLLEASRACRSTEPTREHKPHKNTRRKRRMRAVLFMRDGDKCCHCGKTLAWESATFEHVVPESKGGRFSADNLKLACFPCNNDRGTRDFDEYQRSRGASRSDRCPT